MKCEEALRTERNGAGHDNSAMTSVVLNGVTALSHLGVIRAEGPDAASFLHGQLTQDFALLDASEARLAALCTAKGRVLASFLGIRPQPERILLVCSRDILARDAQAAFDVRAARRRQAERRERRIYASTAWPAWPWPPRLDPAALPGRSMAIGEAHAITLYPSDGVPRALWIAPRATPRPRARRSIPRSGNGARCAAASRPSPRRWSKPSCRRCSTTNRLAASTSRRAAIRARKWWRAASSAAR